VSFMKLVEVIASAVALVLLLLALGEPVRLIIRYRNATREIRQELYEIKSEYIQNIVLKEDK